MIIIYTNIYEYKTKLYKQLLFVGKKNKKKIKLG